MKSIIVLVLIISGVLSLVGSAEPKLTIKPAVKVEFATKLGGFYQLQVKQGDEWKNQDLAIIGTGEPVIRILESGEYRVTQPSNKWVKVWADEFSEKELDYTKWGKEENNYGGGNNERQAYRTDSKYCYIKDGNLNIAVYRDEHTTNDGKKQPYSSARIRSLKRGDWKFGRYEVRAKMPKGQGIWPAVWMLPTESKYGGWASGGEIDIIESRGSVVKETTGALHFGGPWPRNTYLSHSYTFPEKDASEVFHVYAIEWSADEIKWFVDGKLCKTRNKKEWFSEAAKNNPSAPFDQPFHIVINVAVDGIFFKDTKQKADLLADAAFPQVLEIDYVRVYQWAKLTDD